MRLTLVSFNNISRFIMLPVCADGRVRVSPAIMRNVFGIRARRLHLRSLIPQPFPDPPLASRERGLSLWRPHAHHDPDQLKTQ